MTVKLAKVLPMINWSNWGDEKAPNIRDATIRNCGFWIAATSINKRLNAEQCEALMRDLQNIRRLLKKLPEDVTI